MKKFLLAGFAAAALISTTACTDVERSRYATRSLDRPARITCTGFASGVMFDGYSTGKPTYTEGGRLTFVDRATGELIETEGECIVRHRAGL